MITFCPVQLELYCCAGLTEAIGRSLASSFMSVVASSEQQDMGAEYSVLNVRSSCYHLLDENLMDEQQ